eukprot:PhM_4_TR13881/c0_g1_i1/m.56443
MSSSGPLLPITRRLSSDVRATHIYTFCDLETLQSLSLTSQLFHLELNSPNGMVWQRRAYFLHGVKIMTASARDVCVELGRCLRSISYHHSLIPKIEPVVLAHRDDEFVDEGKGIRWRLFADGADSSLSVPGYITSSVLIISTDSTLDAALSSIVWDYVGVVPEVHEDVVAGKNISMTELCTLNCSIGGKTVSTCPSHKLSPGLIVAAFHCFREIVFVERARSASEEHLEEATRRWFRPLNTQINLAEIATKVNFFSTPHTTPNIHIATCVVSDTAGTTTSTSTITTPVFLSRFQSRETETVLQRRNYLLQMFVHQANFICGTIITVGSNSSILFSLSELLQQQHDGCERQIDDKHQPQHLYPLSERSFNPMPIRYADFIFVLRAHLFGRPPPLESWYTLPSLLRRGDRGASLFRALFDEEIKERRHEMCIAIGEALSLDDALIVQAYMHCLMTVARRFVVELHLIDGMYEWNIISAGLSALKARCDEYLREISRQNNDARTQRCHELFHTIVERPLQQKYFNPDSSVLFVPTSSASSLSSSRSLLKKFYQSLTDTVDEYLMKCSPCGAQRFHILSAGLKGLNDILLQTTLSDSYSQQYSLLVEASDVRQALSMFTQETMNSVVLHGLQEEEAARTQLNDKQAAFSRYLLCVLTSETYGTVFVEAIKSHEVNFNEWERRRREKALLLDLVPLMPPTSIMMRCRGDVLQEAVWTAKQREQEAALLATSSPFLTHISDEEARVVKTCAAAAGGGGNRISTLQRLRGGIQKIFKK